jgi:hypothetical protein
MVIAKERAKKSCFNQIRKDCKGVDQWLYFQAWINGYISNGSVMNAKERINGGSWVLFRQVMLRAI